MVRWLANQSSNPTRGSFTERGENEFAFHFWYCETSVKKPMGGGRRPNFVIFVVWSALTVGGWVEVAWGRRPCLGPAKNESFVFLALFRHIVLARSRNLSGASHQPAFMGSYLTINHTCLPYLPSTQVRKFPCVT